jgi:hypothetical protein
MNPFKAAAILSLIVAFCAVAYLAYQYSVIRPKYESEVQEVATCESGRAAATANWDNVQSHIELLKAQGKFKEAGTYATQHADERPLFIGECGQFADLQAPIYTWPSVIAIVGLIAALALFGAARPHVKS